MAWLTRNEQERKALDQLNSDSDRAVALVAATIVETSLTQAIQSRLQANEEIHKELFRPSGPLGAFSTKIDLALLMGIISDGAHKDLKRVKDIRNKFAHRLDVSSFELPVIRDLCANLSWFERHILNPTNPERVKEGLAAGGNYGSFAIGHVDIVEKLKNPRDRYLYCVQVLNAALGYRHDHKPPSPDF